MTLPFATSVMKRPISKPSQLPAGTAAIRDDVYRHELTKKVASKCGDAPTMSVGGDWDVSSVWKDRDPLTWPLPATRALRDARSWATRASTVVVRLKKYSCHPPFPPVPPALQWMHQAHCEIPIRRRQQAAYKGDRSVRHIDIQPKKARLPCTPESNLPSGVAVVGRRAVPNQAMERNRCPLIGACFLRPGSHSVPTTLVPYEKICPEHHSDPLRPPNATTPPLVRPNWTVDGRIFLSALEKSVFFAPLFLSRENGASGTRGEARTRCLVLGWTSMGWLVLGYGMTLLFTLVFEDPVLSTSEKMAESFSEIVWAANLLLDN